MNRRGTSLESELHDINNHFSQHAERLDRIERLLARLVDTTPDESFRHDFDLRDVEEFLRRGD